MATTTNYGMTLLEQAQAQKEVTINEAFGVIDAVLKGSVMDKDLATPPGSPSTGAAYIVASGATGAWNGKVKSIAYYDQIWRFIAPTTGTRVWVSDEQCYYQFNGTVWSASNPTITGNAATATALLTPRNINGVPFDGTADITISGGGGGGNLTGEVTSVGLATTVTNSAVIGKVITGYSSSAGTVSATDTILQAVQKLNGNIALRAPLASPTFTGTVSGITAAMVGAPSGSGTVSGTNTGDQTNITGNAGTATALQTVRTINGVSFDGTANITISATAAANLLTGTSLASGVITSSLTSVGTLTTGTWNAAAVGAVYGGTGQTSYTTGDILYASSGTALSKLIGVATGNALISGGTGTAPSWGKIGITTHISGLATGVATFLATPSSANLISAVTDETGSGALVFGTSPTLAGTPVAPSAAAGTNTTQIATTAFALANNFTLGTPLTTTSGTTQSFTSVIPATAKKVIMNFSGVSTNGTNAYLIQMGVGGSYATTGYNSASTYFQNVGPYAAPARYTAGFGIQASSAAETFFGTYEFNLLSASSNIWCGQGGFMTSSGDYLYFHTGAVTLSGTLDSIRLTTVGGTNTFDAGTINIMWG